MLNGDIAAAHNVATGDGPRMPQRQLHTATRIGNKFYRDA